MACKHFANQEFGAQIQVSCKECKQWSLNFGSSLLSTSCPAQRAKIKWVNADGTSEQLESVLFLHSNASLQGHWLAAQRGQACISPSARLAETVHSTESHWLLNTTVYMGWGLWFKQIQVEPEVEKVMYMISLTAENILGLQYFGSLMILRTILQLCFPKKL